MTDHEFAAMFTAEYERMMRSLKDEDYLVDEAQQEKFLRIVGEFIKLAKEFDGRIDELEVVPRLQHGGVTATFPIVDVSGKSVQDFCSALSAASAITMDAMDDGVCISVTVPNVFYRKP